MESTVSSNPRILELYRSEVAGKLKDEFKYKNPMMLPRLKKIVVNMGVKDAKDDVKIIDVVRQELAQITGQQPVVTKSKKSIAAFKIRQGIPLGVKVTLRGKRMYEFMDRLFNIAMPRIRDFQGYPDNGFDQHGNFTLGLKEQIIFPEIVFDKVKRVQGMDISFVTSANTKAEGKRLLELLGLPFQKKNQ